MKQYKTTIQQYTIKKTKTDFLKEKITSSKSAADYIRKFYFEDLEVFESFFLLCLNRANNTVGYAKISQGGRSSTVVDPAIVAKYAIDNMSSGVILCHNHPSGNKEPSESDKTITQKIKNGLSLFDISVLDHIVLTAEDHYSFADNGLI